MNKTNLYRIHLTLEMIGYMLEMVGKTRALITLEIPDDAITNITRRGIVNVETARYRTNKAKVLKIEDENGKEYLRAVSFNHEKLHEFVLNKTIEAIQYDMNMENVCYISIHFFLTRRCAELYGLQLIENGLYQKWYDNGQRAEECTYKNGLRNGLYRRWHVNGQRAEECMYENGKVMYQSSTLAEPLFSVFTD